MYSIIEELAKKSSWEEYLEYKKSQVSMSEKEIKELTQYINSGDYLNIVQQIRNNTYSFSIPEKHLINKINKTKKRVVYSFNYDENMILKVITFLFIKKYDNSFSENCYSFRRKYTVKDAIRKLSKHNDINKLYGYKIDIKDYFNSVDVEFLIEKLRVFLIDDDELFFLIEQLLKDNRVMFEDEVIYEDKGIMAGVPISSFLANIYLQDIDEYFYNKKVLYIRYSDDIILFDEKNSINKHIKELNEFLAKNKLLINEEKLIKINPGDKWDFLGFSYENGKIDLSKTAKIKIKHKIKNASRKLRRWMIKKDATSDRAIAAVIRKFNKKFYYIDNNNELTWQLWYFPVINTTDGIHEIDVYMQDCLRYIKTGRYNKKNYNLKYEDLKALGYRPLVNEYYKYKKNNMCIKNVEN